jgi:outer membrane protein assembly factor BamB
MSKAANAILLALGPLLLAGVGRQAAAESNAVMFRGNPQHTGVYDTKGVGENPKIKWKFKTGRLNRSTPAVAEGAVYVGSHDGNLYALDAETGKLRWKFPTGGEMTSSPAVAGGTVYFTGGDEYFYALDAKDGRKKWVLQAGEKHPAEVIWDYFQSSPAVVEGVLYFTSDDGYIYAVE